jgi:hypothetical protein
MTHELNWHIPDQVMLLTITGDYTLDAAQAVNQAITEKLSQTKTPLWLIIDATAMSRPYNFQQIRATQMFMDHPKMYMIAIVSSDKLVTLAMMIVFNLGRARLLMFDSVQKANMALQRQMTQRPSVN